MGRMHIVLLLFWSGMTAWFSFFPGGFVFLALWCCQVTFPAAICFVCVSTQNMYAFVYAAVNSKTVVATQERGLASIVDISWKILVDCLVAVRKYK